MNRPRIAGSVLAAYGEVFGQLGAWWQIAALPLAVMIAAALLQLLLPGGGTGGIFLVLCRAAVFAAMEAVILIGWVRAAESEFTVVDPSLNGEPTAAEGRILLWYVGLSVLIGGILPAVLALTGTAASLGTVAAAVALLAVKTRLGFFFVEQALDRPGAAASPWTSPVGGHGWALYGAVLAVHLPPLVALALIAPAAQGDIDQRLANLLVTLPLSGLCPALMASVILVFWRAARTGRNGATYSATVLT